MEAENCFFFFFYVLAQHMECSHDILLSVIVHRFGLNDNVLQEDSFKYLFVCFVPLFLCVCVCVCVCVLCR